MLLVLALVWGAFLVWWLHSRAQGTFGDSVGTFRRHLRVLESAAPSTVRAANQLRGPGMVPAYRPRVGASGVPAARRQGTDLRRRQTLRRRRDVLFVLGIAVIATLVMAAATRSQTIIYLQLLTDGALVAYVALLVRLRNLSAERELKLSYLPSARSPRGSGGYADAPRRSEVPAYAAVARSRGAGYGDLALRRTAN